MPETLRFRRPLPESFKMVLQLAQPDVLRPASTATGQVPARPAASKRRHLLTVNVEDYFQVGVFRKFIQTDHWYRFESRLEQNLQHVLQLLQQHDAQATFFVLGWTAEHYPTLVKSIVEAGHEVASRGFLHQSLTKMKREAIRDDLIRSKATLEDVTGQAIDGFRLSEDWIGKDTLWMLEEIAAVGYRYDSSVLPRQQDFADKPEWRQIQTIATESGDLLEIPISVLPTAAGWLPIAGGNYLRQCPDFIMRRLVDRTIQASPDPYVMYFQVWEIDSEQPELSVADRFTRLRHYRKLDKYRRILPQYLDRYAFTSIRQHANRDDSPLRPLATPSERPSPKLKKLPELAPVRIQTTKSVQGDGTAEADTTAVTIVIPCFNEENTIPYLANTLASVTESLSDNYSPHILFVDDHSTDDTWQVLQRQFGDDPAVSLVRHDVNRGVSAAILTGLKHAGTDIVCSMDCDCSYDPHELANMLPLLTDDVAMVTASPYHKDGLVRNVPAWRLVLSRGLSAIYQRLLKQELATWTSCFRVYRRDQIIDLPLHEDGFLGTAELSAQLVLHNRDIAEHPATLEVRLFGLSKMKTIRAILSHLKLLARIATSRFGTGLPKKNVASRQ